MVGKDRHDDTVYRGNGTRNAMEEPAYQMARESLSSHLRSELDFTGTDPM